MFDEIKTSEHHKKNAQGVDRKSLSMGTCEPAIFILAHDMSVRSTNIAANRILEAGTFVSVSHGRLAGTTEKAEKHLNSMISAANDHGYRALLEGKLISPEQSANRWVAVSRRFGGHTNGESLVMLSLRPLVKSEPLLGREIMWIFGLTPAEARLAVQLAAGLNLAEIADANGVNISTLRAQLRSVYAKTGTGKQSELVAHIWRAAGL